MRSTAFGVAVVLLAGIARGQYSGTMSWTDAWGGVHPCRGVEVRVFRWDSEGDSTIGTTTTDLDGNWSFPAGGFIRPTTVGFGFEARAANSASSVTPWYSETPYSVPIGFTPTGGGPPMAVTVGNTASEDRAFGIADALFTSGYYASRVTGSALTARRTIYPRAGEEGSVYHDATGVIEIGATRWQWWDVINHEYGHYLAQVDHLDNSPGGTHVAGESGIRTNGKNVGVRVAWSEGLATYQGLAAQAMDPVGQHRPAVPAVGDPIYERPGLIQTLESDASGVARGEGDESAVARILWDLYDTHDDLEPWDRIGFGAAGLYSMIDAIGAPDRLDSLWDAYVTAPGRGIHEKVNMGAIFSHNGVSPGVTSGIEGETFTSLEPPTFTFRKGNDGMNDHFGVLVFDEDLSSLVATLFEFDDTELVGASMSHTFSSLEWAMLADLIDESVGSRTFKMVLWGRDTHGPGEFGLGDVAYAGADVTGDYWSDAYAFTISTAVPAPGVAGTLACLGLLTRRRRR